MLRKVQVNPGLRVLLRADRATRYAYLPRVMRVVGQVTFAVVDQTPTPPPPLH